MNIPDIVIELMNYLSTIDLLHFSMVDKLHYKLLDVLISRYDINQEEFFDYNDITILNRSYELYPKQNINIKHFETLKYSRKSKKEYALFITDNARIKVYNNRIKISGTVSRSEFITIINNLLKFICHQFTKHNLIPISTTLSFNENLKHRDYKGIRINNCHSHITANILKFDIYDTHITYIAARNSNKIDSHYNKFKSFYLTYTRFVV